MVEQLVDDPWRELNCERQRLSIEYLKRILERIELSDGTGATSSQFCRLCEENPMGADPARWRPPPTWCDETNNLHACALRALLPRRARIAARATVINVLLDVGADLESSTCRELTWTSWRAELVGTTGAPLGGSRSCTPITTLVSSW